MSGEQELLQADLLLRRSNFVQQLGMAVEQHQKFHQRERRLGLSVFVARKGVGASPEDRGCLMLVKCEPSNSRNESRVYNGGVHLLVELQHGRADT